MSSVASFRGDGDFRATDFDGGVHIPVTGGDEMDPSLGARNLLLCWMETVFLTHSLLMCSVTHGDFAFGCGK